MTIGLEEMNKNLGNTDRVAFKEAHVSGVIGGQQTRLAMQVIESRAASRGASGRSR